MKIKELTSFLEEVAPLSYQENYDNAGLIVGDANEELNAVLISLDVTEEVIQEAINKSVNLIICHHPVIFSGIKKLNGKNQTERIVISAIRNHIAIYAAHTNMDVVMMGVNAKIAEKIGLVNTSILVPSENQLIKLVTFVPTQYAEQLRKQLFAAGAGHIGEYDSCSYNSQGYGTFRALDKANPFVGNKGELHKEEETRIEMIFPRHLQAIITNALLANHPYEEPAFDYYPLINANNRVGIGMVGNLEKEENELEFLKRIKQVFNASVIRHTRLLGKKVKRIAVCGGAGSTFLNHAIAVKADVYITGDFKYHQFFDAEGKIIIADIGHYESEQYTEEIFYDLITKKFSNFAVYLSEVSTNPIKYLK